VDNQEPVSCGVGIVFKTFSDSQEGLVVDGMVPLGPAQRNGIILRGDVLTSVDGVDVRDKPVSFVGGLLLGPPGTTVDLQFARENQIVEGHWQPLQVTLVRAPVVTRSTSTASPMRSLSSFSVPSFQSPASSPQKMATPTKGGLADSPDSGAVRGRSSPPEARRKVYTTFA